MQTFAALDCWFNSGNAIGRHVIVNSLFRQKYCISLGAAPLRRRQEANGMQRACNLMLVTTDIG